MLFFIFFVSRVRDGNGRRRGFSDRYFNILLLLLLDSTERYLLFILTKFRVIFFPRVRALTTFSIRESYRQNEEFPMGRASQKKNTK